MPTFVRGAPEKRGGLANLWLSVSVFLPILQVWKLYFFAVSDRIQFGCAEKLKTK